MYKIVSLVPSITESIIDLGAAESVVGRTKFCIHPKEIVQNIPKIGGTKNLHLDEIKALNPDVIIANKEENIKEQVEALERYCRVWVTDVKTISDNYDLILNLSSLVYRQEEAKRFCLRIEENLEGPRLSKPVKVAYLIWRKPYMTVGKDTFIHEMLTHFGFENIFKHQTRYPTIEANDLEAADVVMLSTEPYPFSEKHIPELQALLPEKKIVIVDGEAFSWYGTHLAKCGTYYADLISSFNENIG